MPDAQIIRIDGPRTSTGRGAGGRGTGEPAPDPAETGPAGRERPAGPDAPTDGAVPTPVDGTSADPGAVPEPDSLTSGAPDVNEPKPPARKAGRKRTAASPAPRRKPAKTNAAKANAPRAASSKAAGSKAAGSKAAGPKAVGPTAVGPKAAGPKAGPAPEARPAPPTPASPEPAPVAAVDPWERRVAGALSFVRRRLTGEYETDEFGYDADLTETILAPALRPLYQKWFRVEMSGLEHIPATGGALIVANHSGTIPVDAAMLQLGLLDNHPARRVMRLLGADLVFQLPFVGELARKTGSTLACQPDAERLLATDQLVGVFPEGFKGVGKPFSDRYKLQRFGRGGFVSAALNTKAPIIPCAIVGAEEIYPKIGDAKLIARLFGLPYFPLTPTFPWLGALGAVPLPSKWYIEFGAPIPTADLGTVAEDPMLVFNVTDQVREVIQQGIYRLLMRRRSVFG